MSPLLAFLMNKRPMDDGPCNWTSPGQEFAYAGGAIFLFGLVWAIGRVIFFQKAKRRSIYPYAAMLLGGCCLVAVMIGFMLGF